MNIEEILKGHKKSVTPERKELFEKMQEFHLFSAADIEKSFLYLGRASIFRTIKLFSELGILRRVSLETGIEQYEVNNPESHHEHMKCTKCQKVLSFDSEFLCKLLSKVAKNYEFTLKEHSINLLGVCKYCQ